MATREDPIVASVEVTGGFKEHNRKLADAGETECFVCPLGGDVVICREEDDVLDVFGSSFDKS